MKVKGIPELPDPVPVPTVAELALVGMAEPVARDGKGNGSHWRITASGQSAIYSVMARNAAAARESDHDRYSRHSPPRAG